MLTMLHPGMFWFEAKHLFRSPVAEKRLVLSNLRIERHVRVVPLLQLAGGEIGSDLGHGPR